MESHTFNFENKEKKRLDDFEVGILVLICMYQVMLFLILQILLAVVGLVPIFLLPGMGILNEKTAESLWLWFLVFAEITLIIVLSHQGKKKFADKIIDARADADQIKFIGPREASSAFTETYLEIAIGATALASLAWCLLLGMPSLSYKIIIIVVEGFALLFLFMFVVIRFLATKGVRLSALASLALTCISL